MAVKTNVKDIGWMYHTSNDAKKAPQVMAPPTSQIPGLGNMADSVTPPAGSGRGLIKDTDTPYIVMAKQGGRRDLLCFSENNSSSNDTKGYPRCDWYYLEDNVLEDKIKNKSHHEQSHDYESHLPEYMVHQYSNEQTKSNVSRSRLPYATDMDLQRISEGNDVLRKPGCNVRLAKAKDGESIQQSVEKRFSQENSKSQKCNKNVPQPMDMGKLLAMDYGKEWINARDNVEVNKMQNEDQGKRRSQHRSSDRVFGIDKSPENDKQSDIQKQNMAPWRPA